MGNQHTSTKPSSINIHPPKLALRIPWWNQAKPGAGSWRPFTWAWASAPSSCCWCGVVLNGFWVLYVRLWPKISVWQLSPGVFAMAATYEADHDPPFDLVKRLDETKSIRKRFLKQKNLLSWVNPEAVGVKSVKAMGLNHVLLEQVAEWWCPQWDHVKMYPIDLARSQARFQHSKRNDLLFINFVWGKSV